MTPINVHVRMDIIMIIVRVTVDNVTEFAKDVNKVDNVWNVKVVAEICLYVDAKMDIMKALLQVIHACLVILIFVFPALVVLLIV